MSNYPIFGGMELDQIIWNYFPSLPSVYDESLSYLEFLGNVLNNMNEERKHVNSMGEAISLFQKFVLEQLEKYSSNSKEEILKTIQALIDDGTIAKLINEVLFNDINQKLNKKWGVYIGSDIEEREDNMLYLITKTNTDEPVIDGNINQYLRYKEIK